MRRRAERWHDLPRPPVPGRHDAHGQVVEPAPSDSEEEQRSETAVGRFSPEDLHLLAHTDEVEIQPVSEGGSPGRRTIIWIVADGEDAYIRSVRGAAGRWYQVLVRGTGAVLHAGTAAWPVRIARVTDAAEVARVSDAFCGKYERAWPGPTAAIVRDEVLATTLRVEPTRARGLC